MGREAPVAAGRTQQGAKREGRALADARVAAMLARHGGALMRVARQWSICQDDASDAFQRGLEIYVRRLESVEPATEAAWLKVVIRHEAMAIRRARTESVPDRELDLDAFVPAPQRSVEDQVLSGDRVRRSAEALRALKPDEARALMLKAHGMSYEEIARHCGWTYTKVNRAITEGRRRFMELYAALEAGEECERFAPILRALAAGTATSEQLVEIRPHLRRCLACRATVRDLHRAGVRRFPLFAPLAALLDWARRALRPSPAELPDEAVVEERASRLEALKHHGASLVHRTNTSDIAAAIHAFTTAGGGRIATLGTIVGLCVSSVGAGTVCLVTGVLHSPFGDGPGSERHTVVHRPRPPRDAASLPRHTARPLATEMIVARVTPTPTPTPTPRPRSTRRVPHRRARRPSATPVPVTIDPSQGTAPSSQEHAPISPAPAQPAAEEFAAAPSSGAGTQPAPAPPPATGGGEFAP
jgi:RNA polymerase sigma factor (sigma-70 family)